jgi:hypothetical protein
MFVHSQQVPIADQVTTAEAVLADASLLIFDLEDGTDIRGFEEIMISQSVLFLHVDHGHKDEKTSIL